MVVVTGAWQHLWAGVTVAQLMMAVLLRQWMRPLSVLYILSV